MNYLKSFFTVFTILLVFSSCQKENFTDIQQFEDPYYTQVDFTPYFTAGLEAYQEKGANVKSVYTDVSKAFKNEKAMLPFKEFHQLQKDYASIAGQDLSLYEVGKHLNKNGMVSSAEIAFLPTFDALIFNAATVEQAIANMASVDEQIQVSDALTADEKLNLRELNAILYHSFKFQQEHSLLKSNGVGCAAGILVALGGGLALSPTALMASIMMIDKWC